jgi:YVTN family beta-propeller protein
MAALGAAALGVLVLAAPALAYTPPNSILTTVPIGTGAEPQTVSVDPLTHQVFVLSFGGSLSVIDQRTDTLVNTINLGPGYWVPMGIDPYTGRIYAASETYNGSGIIDEISVRTGAILKSWATPDDPHAIAVDPYRHTVYIANYCEPSCQQASVSVLDERTNAITDTIGIGAQPQDAVFDPRNGEVIVTNYGSEYPDGGTVSIIDTWTNTVKATVTVGAYPWGEALDAITGKVYVADVFGDSISVVDLRTDTVTDTIAMPDSAHPIYVGTDPASDQVYASVLGGDQLQVIDGRTDDVYDTLTIPSVGPMASDPAANRLYVGSRGTVGDAGLVVVQTVPGFSWRGPW